MPLLSHCCAPHDVRSQNMAAIIIYEGCKRAGTHLERTYEGAGALTEKGAKSVLKMYYDRCKASVLTAKSVLGYPTPDVDEILEQAELEFTPKVACKSDMRATAEGERVADSRVVVEKVEAAKKEAEQAKKEAAKLKKEGEKAAERAAEQATRYASHVPPKRPPPSHMHITHALHMRCVAGKKGGGEAQEGGGEGGGAGCRAGKEGGRKGSRKGRQGGGQGAGDPAQGKGAGTLQLFSLPRPSPPHRRTSDAPPPSLWRGRRKQRLPRCMTGTRRCRRRWLG